MFTGLSLSNFLLTYFFILIIMCILIDIYHLEMIRLSVNVATRGVTPPMVSLC